MTVTDRFALLVLWLRSEPVATRLLAAAAATWLAKQGINLDPLVVGPIAVAVAGWAARRKVSPVGKPKVVVLNMKMEGDAQAYVAAMKEAQRRASLLRGPDGRFKPN